MRRVILGSLFLLPALAWSACESDPGINESQFPPLSQHQGSGSGTDGGVVAEGGAGADAAVVPIAISNACADLAKARCTQNDACTGGLRNVALYGGEPTCEERVSLQCVVELSAPSIAQTAVTVEACAVSIATQSCADAFDEVPTAACVPIAGALTTGAACIASSQCGSTYCAIAPNAVCGSCAAVPKAGDHCGSTAECGDRGGLTCAGGVCIPIGQSGSPCTSAIPCGYGLSCVGGTASAPGTCQSAAADAGAACDPTGATAPSCGVDLGLTCDPATRACVPTTYATGGAECGKLDAGVAGCAAGACIITVPDAGTIVDAGVDAADAGDGGDDAATVDAGPATAPGAPTTGVCAAAAKDGTECDVALGPPCLPPAQCVSGDGGTAGTCMLPSAGTCK
jgi:hypothetical protein